MASGREPGKGQGAAVSKMVEPTFSVWLDQVSRNVMMKVPNRITMEQLVRQISRELGADIGNATQWKLWRGDHMAAPPLTEGEEYGLIQTEIRTRPVTKPISRVLARI
jgi:hypothetical protein